MGLWGGGVGRFRGVSSGRWGLLARLCRRIPLEKQLQPRSTHPGRTNSVSSTSHLCYTPDSSSDKRITEV